MGSRVCSGLPPDPCFSRRRLRLPSRTRHCRAGPSSPGPALKSPRHPFLRAGMHLSRIPSETLTQLLCREWFGRQSRRLRRRHFRDALEPPSRNSSSCRRIISHRSTFRSSSVREAMLNARALVCDAHALAGSRRAVQPAALRDEPRRVRRLCGGRGGALRRAAGPERCT